MEARRDTSHTCGAINGRRPKIFSNQQVRPLDGKKPLPITQLLQLGTLISASSCAINGNLVASPLEGFMVKPLGTNLSYGTPMPR